MHDSMNDQIEWDFAFRNRYDQWQELGLYSPIEATNLVEELELEGIAVCAEAYEPMPGSVSVGFGGHSSILIMVDPAQTSRVDRVHQKILDCGIPPMDADDDLEALSDSPSELEFELIKQRERLLGKLAPLEREFEALLAEIETTQQQIARCEYESEEKKALESILLQCRQSVEHVKAKMKRVESDIEEISSHLNPA